MVLTLVENFKFFVHSLLTTIVMTGEHAYHIKRKKVLCTLAINHHLKGEISSTLRCQLCSTHYVALRIKNYS